MCGWVETKASPPAAGGVAIPSRIVLSVMCPVLLAAPTLKLNYNDGGEDV